MKKMIAIITLAIVCTAALFADAIIVENEDTFILAYSTNEVIPDLEIPGETWTYYERFEVTDQEVLDQYMSRLMSYFMSFDSDTLDMRVMVDGSDMVCIITTDLELINSLAGI